MAAALAQSCFGAEVAVNEGDATAVFGEDFFVEDGAKTGAVGALEVFVNDDLDGTGGIAFNHFHATSPRDDAS